MSDNNNNTNNNNTNNSNGTGNTNTNLNWINNLTTGNVSEMKVVERGFTLDKETKKK